MGKIAEALRANLQAIAQSDARSLRELDQELRNATEPATAAPQLTAPERMAALLGKGSFQQQTVATLKRLCKEHAIKGYSKLRKAELAKELERHGVVPPPRPLENFKQAELIALVKQLLEQLG